MKKIFLIMIFSSVILFGAVPPGGLSFKADREKTGQCEKITQLAAVCCVGTAVAALMYASAHLEVFGNLENITEFQIPQPYSQHMNANGQLNHGMVRCCLLRFSGAVGCCCCCATLSCCCPKKSFYEMIREDKMVRED